MKLDIEEILKDWEKDSKIDPLNLDGESLDTPKLHSKYLNILMVIKLQLKKRENKQKEMLRDKWLYFSGKMDQAEVTSRGWKADPFDGLTILKSDMHYYFEADKELQNMEEKVVYLKSLKEAVQDIVDAIRWRHTHIKNAIDWRRFTSGG